MPTNTAHLFFSYAHADTERMTPLHARMQAATGHNLWIDKVGLHRGVEWENAIKAAITDSYGVILAITTAFCAEDRIFIRDKEIPWTIDRFRNIQGPLIFQIIFDDVELPPVLQAAMDDKDLRWLFHKIDFRDGDEARLFAELKEILPQPSAGNHPFIIDWPRLTTFQGRDALLVELHDKLKGSAVSIKTAGLHGMGGIGKTQLAVEYAHRYRFHYPAGVYWVNAARADWTAEVAEIAERLGLQPPEAEGQKRERGLVAAFARYLRDLGGDALLILDNIENPADVPNREIGPKLRFTDFPAHLLITTRRQDLPDGFAALPVNLLPPADARALLLTARPDAKDDPALDDICKVLGYLPLALGLAAAALKKRPTMKPAVFLQHLREKGVDTIASAVHLSSGDLGAREDYVILLSAALDWHWEQIGENARNVIALAAAYGEAAQLPLARLQILSGLDNNPDEFDQPFTDALTELRAASLVESLGDTAIRLHPLVRDYVRRTVPDFPVRLAQAAERLYTAYRTPQIIYDQSVARTFGALITDLQETAANLSPDAHSLNPIRDLTRLFDLEGHHLRTWKPETNPAYLIQSLRERSHHQSDDAFRDACDKWLALYIHFRTANVYHFPYDPALIRIFEGHTGGVTDVSVLPDGKRALSASADETLRLWDIETGAEIRRFEGHTSLVTAVTVLPDGQRALSGSSDNTLRLWDIETGAEIRRFEGHTRSVTEVTVLPDGRRALSASADRTLRLWDIESGAEIRRFEGHTKSVSAVTVLPDGKRALSASYDRTLRLWDIESGAEIRRFEGHTQRINAVTVLPDGKRALSASEDTTLRLWDIESGAEIRRFEGHTESVSAVTVLLDGKRALSASYDGSLRLWDIESGAEIRRFDRHTQRINAVTILLDGKRALSASRDETLRLWDMESGAEIGRFKGHTESVNGVTVLPDSCHALSASGDRYDTRGKPELILWDIESGAEIRRFEGHTQRINAVTVLPDGKRALSASEDTTLRLWDIESGAEIRRFEGHTSEIYAVAVLPDGQRMLSASGDQTLRLWDIESGTEIRRYAGHTSAVYTVAVLPDGQRALSGSYDCTLRLWEIENGAELRHFTGHIDSVKSVIVLPDRWYVLSASYDNTLRLWDIESAVCLAVLRLEEASICLALIPNAAPSSDIRVFVGSESGKVRVISLHFPPESTV